MVSAVQTLRQVNLPLSRQSTVAYAPAMDHMPEDRALMLRYKDGDVAALKHCTGDTMMRCTAISCDCVGTLKMQTTYFRRYGERLLRRQTVTDPLLNLRPTYIESHTIVSLIT